MSIPIRDWQIEYSKEKGLSLINLVEKHKVTYGNYPKSFSEIKGKMNLKVPKWTALGTKYTYDFFENGNYIVGFKSYYGYDLYYDKLNKEWIAYD
ncbi:hypothetical protein [Mesoflavibacter zeaxanthinifaciens]|uniref:hypothetical protein n=1 Tax=Mesoflavibacter zeaxanthinifaciens TaxID=393060 RepID=UPI003A904790